MAPSFEMSVTMAVFTPISRSSSRKSNMSTSRTSSQPLTATLPSFASTPTAILSPHFARASFRNSLSVTALVPRITLDTPASRYFSMVSKLLIPPPISTLSPVSCAMDFTTSKFGVVPSLAPSRSTRCSHLPPIASMSLAVARGSSL